MVPVLRLVSEGKATLASPFKIIYHHLQFLSCGRLTMKTLNLTQSMGETLVPCFFRFLCPMIVLVPAHSIRAGLSNPPSASVFSVSPGGCT